jgi:hypothetical protein
MREDRRQIVPRRVGAALRRVGVSLRRLGLAETPPHCRGDFTPAVEVPHAAKVSRYWSRSKIPRCPAGSFSSIRKPGTPSTYSPGRHQRRPLDSNRSLPTFEPVSVREREFRWEKVRRGQRLGGIFSDIGRFRATETVLAAKPRNVKDYSGGAQKPQLRRTGNQPIMGRKGSYQGPHRCDTDCASAVTVGSCGPVPSIIAAKVRGAMNASGVRRRMCLSTLPSCSAISAND